SLLILLDNSRFPPPIEALTDNGIHLTAYGYRRAAEALAQGLGWQSHTWRLGIVRSGGIREGTYGVQVLEVKKDTNYATFTTINQQLETPPWLDNETPKALATPENRVQIIGLAPGKFDWKLDGYGMAITEGPQFEQAELLRQTIIKKNELFFHRWRPQNNTYLFLFRKHEQGQNAKEIPQFDPLIEEAEKKIAELRKPVKHVTEFIWSGAGAPPKAAKPSKAEEKPAAAQTPLPLPKLELEDGLEISLWAENPLLAKPIQMNFDARGRLWIASSSVYPQIQPGQVADDKILILEDTDNDGKADKTTVFADGLLIPTGVEPGNGGAYVGQSTELLFFKDTDG